VRVSRVPPRTAGQTEQMTDRNVNRRHRQPPRLFRGARLLRRAAQRVAVVGALLILYYATSLHGVSMRTLVLAGVLVLGLYWMFKGVL
jgi:hypothetical protein